MQDICTRPCRRDGPPEEPNSTPPLRSSAIRYGASAVPAAPGRPARDGSLAEDAPGEGVRSRDAVTTQELRGFPAIVEP